MRQDNNPVVTDLLHRSHNVPIPYLTVHHFVTEMCTCVHISVTKIVHCGIFVWCIVEFVICVYYRPIHLDCKHTLHLIRITLWVDPIHQPNLTIIKKKTTPATLWGATDRCLPDLSFLFNEICLHRRQPTTPECHFTPRWNQQKINHLGFSAATPWWRHDMEALSALLPICEGNPPVTGGFP